MENFRPDSFRAIQDIVKWYHYIFEGFFLTKLILFKEVKIVLQRCIKSIKSFKKFYSSKNSLKLDSLNIDNYWKYNFPSTEIKYILKYIKMENRNFTCIKT